VSSPTTTSVIHDIGYKPYTGPRLGRVQILRALYVHGLRACFGFGRGPKAKIVPWFVLLVMMIVAALNVYSSSDGRDLVMGYSVMGYRLSLLVVLLVAVAAPELVSRDLRHHTLPLYFSRPLRRADYPLAKLLALASAVLTVTLLPVLVTYLGQVASSNSGHEIWLDTRAAFPGLFVAVLQSAVFSVVGLLLAAATGRRVIATGLIAIFFLVTTALSHAMTDALGTRWADHTATCVVPQPGPDSNDGPICPGLHLIGGRLAVDGQPDPARPGYLDLTVDYQTPIYSAIAKAGGLVNPQDLVEGARVWVFDATDSDQPDPSPLGPVYGLELAVLVFAGTGGLLLRYRKVSVS